MAAPSFDSIAQTLSNAFMTGEWSDCVLHVQFQDHSLPSLSSPPIRRSFQLHRLLLSRSPFLANIMKLNPTTDLQILIEDKNVDEHSLSIALSHLYNPFTASLINHQNARGVLAAATFLRLEDLFHQALEICLQAIEHVYSPEVISSWFDFVDTKIPDHTLPPPYTFPTSGSSAIPFVQIKNEDGTPLTGTSLYGEAALRMREKLLDHVQVELPRKLQAFESPENSEPAGGLATLIQIYSRLPFEVFKVCVESPNLPIPHEGSSKDKTLEETNHRERFDFAKRCIAQRKRLSDNKEFDETVVLAFGGGSSNVSVIRKQKRNRQLWKIQGDR